jgi:hypothetical protein
MPHLLTEAEIVEAAVLPGARKTGVYFLVKDGELKYIGQSTDIEARIYNHRWREFDSWHSIACEPGELKTLERAYIDKFLPPWNRDSETVAKRGDNRLRAEQLPAITHPFDGIDRATWDAVLLKTEDDDPRAEILERMKRVRAMRTRTQYWRDNA